LEKLVIFFGLYELKFTPLYLSTFIANPKVIQNNLQASKVKTIIKPRYKHPR